MTNKPRKGKTISRRNILPILGGSLILPFLGFGNTVIDERVPLVEEEFKTLLKPDGTTVKVRVSTLNNSKVIKKSISNKSFLNWLGKKL